MLSKSFLVGLVVLQICNKPEVNLCINCFDTTTKEETAEFRKLYTTNHKKENIIEITEEIDLCYNKL